MIGGDSMLDPVGIKLSEIEYKYPKLVQNLGYDVLLDTDSLYKPKVIPTFQLCINSILTLLFMKPGQYPSIPELGIDVEQYMHEFSDDSSVPHTIREKLYQQLSMIQMTNITIEVSFDKLPNGTSALLIQVNGTEYNRDPKERLSPVIIGITYDHLNRLYSRVSYAKDRYHINK